MSRPRDDRDLARLCGALRAQPYAEPGPARFEFERRRFMARLERDGEPNVRPERRVATWTVVAWATAAAIVAAVIVGVLVWRADVGGTVTLAGSWHLEPGDAMSRGALVRVPAEASAKVVLPDGTSLWFERGSEFELADEMGDRVDLHSGRMLAKVAPRVAPRSFSVVTEEATVVVHGTVFSVSSNPDGAVIRLHEGKIRVLIDGEGIDVEPGHQLEVGVDGLERMRPFGAAEKLADIAFVQEDMEHLTPSFGEVRDESFLLEPREKSDGLETVRGGVTGDGESGQDEFIPEDRGGRMGDRLPDSAPRKGEDRFGGEEGKDERAASKESADVRDMAERIREQYRLRQWSRVVELSEGFEPKRPDVLYFRGKSLERLGRLEKAAATFEQLARLAPERGAQSLYLAAKARFHLGQYAEAFDLAVEAASTGGSVAEQARYLALRAAFAAGHHGGAETQARRYLEDFPRGAYVEDALYSLAVSLFHLEDFGASEESFRHYLERFPQGRYAEKARRALSLD